MNRNLLIAVVMMSAVSGCVSGPTAEPEARLRQDIPILIYHHIDQAPATATRSQRRWYISPQAFEKQMHWLDAHGFRTISMEQLVRHFESGETLPNKPVVLTFDDGWREHYRAALPILQKHHFTATFFIITDSIGHSVYMSWDDVKALSAAGMDIQSHTRTHPRLSVLSNDQIRDEIVRSKRILEEKIQKPVMVLAYPFGSYDDDVIALTKAAGYSAAATVSGLNGGYLWRADHTFTLDRYAVENGDNLAGIGMLNAKDPHE